MLGLCVLEVVSALGFQFPPIPDVFLAKSSFSGAGGALSSRDSAEVTDDLFASAGVVELPSAATAAAAAAAFDAAMIGLRSAWADAAAALAFAWASLLMEASISSAAAKTAADAISISSPEAVVVSAFYFVSGFKKLSAEVMVCCKIDSLTESSLLAYWLLVFFPSRGTLADPS